MHEGEPYREFIILWHVYLKQIKSAALNLDEQQLRILCMYTLKTFLSHRICHQIQMDFLEK